MLYSFPIHCPVCQEKFHVKRLACENCGSELEGTFELSRLSQLSSEMQQFIIVFLECRGNIREMEKYFNISYPTVRVRIDDIVAALGGQMRTAPVSYSDIVEQQESGEFEINDPTPEGEKRQPKTSRLDVLTMLSNGEIELDAAQELLENLEI